MNDKNGNEISSGDILNVEGNWGFNEAVVVGFSQDDEGNPRIDVVELGAKWNIPPSDAVDSGKKIG